jgi:predicted lipid-binding transport protein (Tim44 family)
MQKFISMFLILITCLFVLQDVQAKRFGGGRSFGISRSASSFSRTSRPAAAPFQNYSQTGQAARPRNSWLGPLAGFAAGGILASLLSGHGFGGGMGWLMIAGLGLLAFSFLRRSSVQAASPPNYHMHQQDQHYTSHARENYQNQSRSLPADFNEQDFLRQAKVQFIRLQAAYDQKNLQDLGQFTTPDVFAEIKMQLNEGGNALNQTDVVTLDAELLDVNAVFREVTASVRFTGLIKEEANAAAINVREIWHFRQSPDSHIWQVAGIQQELN